MIRNGEMYCNRCFMVIDPRSKYASFKIPAREGKDPNDYLHYHNRYQDDCFGKEVEKLQREHVPKWRHQ